MAEFTSNFNLKKPDETDFFNIEDFNGNMDILDEKLKEASQNEQLQGDVSDIKGTTEEIKNALGSSADISSSPTIFGKIADIKETLISKFSDVVSRITGIDGKIGTATDTGGTASAGSIFAKINKLLTDWTSTRAGRIDSIYTNTETSTSSSSTGTLSQKLNYIKGLIGTSGDSGTTSVFGKLNNIEKNQIKYVVASDNEKIKLLDNVNLRIDHTLNTETTKGVYIGVTKLPYFTGTLKVKVEYSAKFNVANSNNYWRLIVYDTGFASMLDSAATYNNTSFINKIDNKTKGTIFDKYRDGVNGFGSNQINIIDTNIKNGVIENTVKFVGGYIPELVVGVECPSSRQSGYCIIKNVSICYDEVTA